MAAASLALGLTACAAADDAGSETATPAVAATMVAARAASEMPAVADDGSSFAAAGDAAPAAAEEQAQAGGEAGLGSLNASSPVVAGRQLIYTGSVRMETADVKASVSVVTRIIEDAQGVIVDSELDYDPMEPHARLTVKLPPHAVNGVLGRLNEVGNVVGGGQTAQDVTGQIIDLDARILTAIASVDRARAFLEKATTVGELAQLESELTSRETTLEQLRAQQKALKDQVASATLTIEIALPPPAVERVPEIVEEPTPWQRIQNSNVGAALAKGWRGFTSLLKALAVVLALGAPFLAVAGLVVLPLIGRRLRDRRRQRAATAGSDSGGASGGRGSGGPGAPPAPPTPPAPMAAPTAPSAEQSREPQTVSG